MAVEEMQFAMPMAAGYEDFPFTTFQAEKEQAEPEAAIIKAKAEPEAAILKARSKAEKGAAILKAKSKAEKGAAARSKAEKGAAILKAKSKAVKGAAILRGKSKADKGAAILKAKAEAAKEAAIIKAKAEAAKEEGIVKASCCGSGEGDLPYDKVYHDSDDELDHETAMSRIEARWDIFMKVQEARFPDMKYRVYQPGEYTGDETSDSDDGQEFYRRKFEEAGHVWA